MTKSKMEFVSASILAEWLGLSARRTRELGASGVLARHARNKYDLRLSIVQYCAHLREQAAGRAGIDESTNIAAANVAQKRSAARLADLRYAREAGKLIEVDLVQQIWGRLVIGIRDRNLALPAKFAFEIPTLTATDRATIERIVRDDLEDAALGRGFDFDGIGDAVPAADGEAAK